MDLRSSVLDELLVTEGLLFKDECAKLLYMDVKSLVNKTLYAFWEDKQSTEEYLEHLKNMLEWEEEIEESQEQRVSSYCLNNLPKVTILYAKYLFSKEDSKDVIKIRKPEISTLLYGIYKRLCKTTQIRSGSYFDLDPLRQDFVFREAFRMALSDCIDIIEDKKVNKEEDEDKKLEEEMKLIEEITEQDSISNFCGRTVLSFKPEKVMESINLPSTQSVIPQSVIEQNVIEQNVKPQSVIAHSVDAKSVVAQSVAKSVIPQSVTAKSVVPQSVKPQSVIPQSVIPQSVKPEEDKKSTQTKISKAPTSVSTFSKPQFRKITLDEVPI